MFKFSFNANELKHLNYCEHDDPSTAEIWMALSMIYMQNARKSWINQAHSAPLLLTLIDALMGTKCAIRHHSHPLLTQGEHTVQVEILVESVKKVTGAAECSIEFGVIRPPPWVCFSRSFAIALRHNIPVWFCVLLPQMHTSERTELEMQSTHRMAIAVRWYSYYMRFFVHVYGMCRPHISIFLQWQRK